MRVLLLTLLSSAFALERESLLISKTCGPPVDYTPKIVLQMTYPASIKALSEEEVKQLLLTMTQTGVSRLTIK